MPSVTSKQAEQMRIAQRATKPSAKEFQDATGASDQDVNSVLYGTIGSNVDTRDWAKIMASSDPLAAAREATRQYYDQGAVTVEYTPQEKKASLQNAMRQEQERRQRVMDMILSGQAADAPTAYGFTQQQIDAARAARSSGQGLGSFIQQQGMAAFAPAQRKSFNRQADEIKSPTTVQFTQRVPGTPIAQSVDDPDDPNSRLRNRFIDAQGNPIAGFDLRRMQNFGYNPYTLQPMYTAQQDPQTGQVSYTPAFDTSTLGYEFGDVDPYSQEGLQAYYGVPSLTVAETPTENALRTQTYDILGDIMDRMGYEYEPYDFSYTVK